MQPAEINFTAWRNADWQQVIIWTGVDLSSSTFEMDIKAAPGTGSVLVAATIDDTDADAGKLVMSFADESLAAGAYVYDLVRIDSGIRSILAYGTFTVIEGVTQP